MAYKAVLTYRRAKETVFNTENSEESFENRSPKSQNSVGQESRTKGLGNKGGHQRKDLKDYAIHWTVDALDEEKSSEKEQLRPSCLDFEKFAMVEELKFNFYLFLKSVIRKHNLFYSQIKNVLSISQVQGLLCRPGILRALEKNDVIQPGSKDIIPSRWKITCLVARQQEDEAVPMAQKTGACQLQKYQKIGFKGNLVRGLPSKTFKIDHSCVTVEGTAITPPQSTGNTHLRFDDDTPKMVFFSSNLDAEEGGVAVYNNLDTIKVSLTPHLEFIRIHLKVKLLAKVTVGFNKKKASRQGTQAVSQALADESWVIATAREELASIQATEGHEGVHVDLPERQEA
ncbi:hypothetical protein Tco_0039452 [Tanacetum coccineum]